MKTIQDYIYICYQEHLAHSLCELSLIRTKNGFKRSESHALQKYMCDLAAYYIMRGEY